MILPTGLGSGEEDNKRKKEEPKPAPLPEIPSGGWKSPESDGSYVPPQDPYQSGNVGPGYVRPSNWQIDK
ncbi:MAG: hypothetical protein FJZ01_26410 [Candidatus Sericytochromatia bacterium]|nr:hypothetical protein [Candidatus Tanganyikabacteria bacterium]